MRRAFHSTARRSTSTQSMAGRAQLAVEVAQPLETVPQRLGPVQQRVQQQVVVAEGEHRSACDVHADSAAPETVERPRAGKPGRVQPRVQVDQDSVGACEQDLARLVEHAPLLPVDKHLQRREAQPSEGGAGLSEGGAVHQDVEIRGFANRSPGIEAFGQGGPLQRDGPHTVAREVFAEGSQFAPEHLVPRRRRERAGGELLPHDVRQARQGLQSGPDERGDPVEMRQVEEELPVAGRGRSGAGLALLRKQAEQVGGLRSQGRAHGWSSRPRTAAQASARFSYSSR